MNSLTIITRYAGNVPILLYDYNADELKMRISSALPEVLQIPKFVDYLLRAAHVLRHVNFQARGHPSGVHGLFHQ